MPQDSPPSTEPTVSVGSLAERGCATKAGLVNIEEPVEYVERSIRSGPVLFGNAATFDEIALEHLGPVFEGRYRAVKLPITVAAGQTATVVIAPTSRAWASLRYESTAVAPSYELADGTHAARFTACDRGDTLFAGGVIVTSPGCLELLVLHDAQSVMVNMAIGPADC